jgi:hypothetical protein
MLVGNVTAKCLNAISTLFDMYADLERESWTEEQIILLETRCRRFHTAFLMLWELKTSLVNYDGRNEEDDVERKMKIMKIHNQQHFPEFIRFYGSPKHSDTESWESSHRKYTKNAFERTSKRPRNLSVELIEMAVKRSRSSMAEVSMGILEHGAEYFDTFSLGPTRLDESSVNRTSRGSKLYDILRNINGGLVCVRLSNGVRELNIDGLFRHTVITGECARFPCVPHVLS